MKNWKNIKGYNFKTYVQKKLIKKNNAPYFSRLEFEMLIENLPRGYDTKLLDLIIMGYICRNNRVFFDYLLAI